MIFLQKEPRLTAWRFLILSEVPWTTRKVIIKYEITADVPEIKKLISEFGKIGSNLNQIARYFNQGGIISTEMKNEIRKSLRDIYEMKYEVMKMAGDFRGSN